jgi:hypothetical protein
MATQTTLSAAPPLHPEPRTQWHRHSCLPREPKGLCAVAKPRTEQLAGLAASQPAKILIANARLGFRLSHSKRGLLKISNRERIAIFHLARKRCILSASNVERDFRQGMASAVPRDARLSGVSTPEALDRRNHKPCLDGRLIGGSPRLEIAASY